MSEVTVADISDIIAGRPEDEALRTLKIISGALKKFDLVEVDVSDNAMGAKGCLACEDILTKSSLQVLNLIIKLHLSSIFLTKHFYFVDFL